MLARWKSVKARVKVVKEEKVERVEEVKGVKEVKEEEVVLLVVFASFGRVDLWSLLLWYVARSSKKLASSTCEVMACWFAIRIRLVPHIANTGMIELMLLG